MRLHNNFGRFFITLKLALLQAIILVRISCQKVVKSEFCELREFSNAFKVGRSLEDVLKWGEPYIP